VKKLITKNQIDSWVQDIMSNFLDEYLSKFGFVRKKKSIKYIRMINDGKQEIEITVFVKPNYAKDANAHVYPNVTIVLPNINKISLDMVGEKTLLANAPEITLRQPIDLLADKDQRERWFLYDESSVLKIGPVIKQYLDERVIQFLDDYSTPEGIIKSYESNDKRVMAQDHWYIRVAACYILLNRLKEAQEVLFDRFSSQASRRRYQRVFEYLDNLNA
jgi:hypothetical protein